MKFNQSFNSTSLKVTNKKSPLPIVYVYGQWVIRDDPSEKQIFIDFNQKKLLPGSGPLIGISNSTSRSGQPFIVLNGGQYPPDFIVSDTNQMKVEVYQTFNIEANVQLMDKDRNSTVIAHVENNNKTNNNTFN